jgi:uncharacterized OB-fold protein
MSYRPLKAWLFRVDGDVPVLLGSQCASCHQSFFPRRRLCPICLQLAAELELPGRGTLYSHTYVHLPPDGRRGADTGGCGVGEVDLANGPRIQTVLTGEPKMWEIGMPMRIHLDFVDRADGDELVTFCFRPDKEHASA